MAKLKVDELLRLACIYAETDREGYIDAIKNTGNEDEIKGEKAFLDQLQAYRKKRWGKTQLEALMGDAVRTPISEILSKAKDPK